MTRHLWQYMIWGEGPVVYLTGCGLCGKWDAGFDREYKAQRRVERLRRYIVMNNFEHLCLRPKTS